MQRPHSANSKRSKCPQGSLKASATKKSCANCSSLGASTSGSNLSHGVAVVKDTASVASPASLTSHSLVLSSLNRRKPTATNPSPAPRNDALILAFAAAHSLRRDRASSDDEVTFLRAAVNFGFEGAVYLAAKLHWKCQRPLRALRAMLGERTTSTEPTVRT